MFSEVQFAALPFVALPQRAQLPNCPAIYFAIDHQDRVLYIGKASNLLARWKEHHRFEQLNRLHKKSPVRLAWLDCSSCIDQLDAIESHYIAVYKPLLNGTKVPAKKITAAEIALQETLSKLAKYCVVFGVAPASEIHPLPTINIRYFGSGRVVNSIRQICKASNRKPTGLRWVEF